MYISALVDKETVAQASSSMHACKNYMYEIHTLTLTLKKSSMSWFLHTHHCTSSRSCADVDCPAAVVSYNARSSFLSSGHISTSTPEPGAPCRGDDSLATHKIGKFKSSLLVPAHKERAGFFSAANPSGNHRLQLRKQESSEGEQGSD